MKRSTNRILTSHAGSLPRPADLLDMNRAKQAGRPYDQDAWAARVRSGVAEVVREQADAGIDVVNDGEYGKLNFLVYADERLAGFERRPRPGVRRRNFAAFSDFYDELWQSRGGPVTTQPTCIGPISYIGHSLLQADLDNLNAALRGVATAPMGAAQIEEAFVTSIAPGTFGRGQNQYYKSEEEFLFAIADALKEEYKAIVDAGFVLQLDDPGLPDTWDMLDPEPTVDEYHRFAMLRVEALNHALADIPEDRIRYHICWGSWHGPHTTDIPLRNIVDLLLRVKAQTYSLEAGNVRHEHDWKVWRDVKLPQGKLLMPGVVSHATNIVEDPELVADRIVQYTGLVGRENVIAGTDCGLGGRVHPQIAWAKLRALAEGAARASKQLWSG